MSSTVLLVPGASGKFRNQHRYQPRRIRATANTTSRPNGTRITTASQKMSIENYIPLY